MKWAFRVFAVKYVKRLIQIALAWIAGHNLERFGVKIDEVQASAAVWSGLELLRNYVKTKFNWKFL